MGIIFAVPVTATFCVADPVDVIATLPVIGPIAVFVKRMYTRVEATIPPLCGSVTLGAKPLPDVVDTSKPDGGVTTILAKRVEPLTLKLCWADAVPEHVVNALNAPVTLVRVGSA